MGAKYINTTKTLPLIKVSIGTIVRLGSHLLMNVVIDTFTKETVYYDFTDGRTSSYKIGSKFSKREAVIVEEAITIKNPKI